MKKEIEIENEYKYKMSEYLLHNLLKRELITQKEYYNILSNLIKEYNIKDKEDE